MLVFLVKGDSTAIDTVRTYEIPEIVYSYHDISVAGEITPGFYDHSVSDMLFGLPFVPISCGFGQVGTIVNKGRKPNYTRIYLNGHLLPDHPLGYVNLGLLPLNFSEKLSFGQIAAGSELSCFNLVSGTNRYERPYSRVNFMFGSFGSNIYRFDLTRGITDELGFYLSGSYYKTDGHRQNSDAQVMSLYSHIYLDYSLPIRFDLFYANNDCGFPGSTTLPLGGHQKDQLLDVSGTVGFGRGMLTLVYDRRALDYNDTLYEKSLRITVDHFGLLSERHDTLFGTLVDYGASGFVTHLDGGAYPPTGLNRLNVWARLTKSVGRGFVRASGNVESANYHDIFWRPKIEIGMYLLGSAYISAALSRDARAPSDFERWAPFDSLNPYFTVAGNEFLLPEYCWSEEIGLRGKVFFLNLYRLRFDDYITVYPVSDDYYKYCNLERWETTGLEGYLQLPFRLYNPDSSTMTEFAVSFGGNVLMSGDSMPYVPHHYVNAAVSARRETSRFSFGVALHAEFSSIRRDLSGAEYFGYNIYSAAGFVKFMSLSCVLRLNNAFDEEYAYLPDYPMPPRNFDVSIKWEFWD
jgi:hypothetical protein